MGTCAYCSQGIAECHQIRSADGHLFTVGCDCVRKVHEKGDRLLTKAEEASRKLRNAKARERAAAKARAVTEKLDAYFSDPEWGARMAAKPHPNELRREMGETLLDSYEYRRRVSGAQGRAKLLEEIEA